MGSPSSVQPARPSCPWLLAALLALWVTPQLPDAAVAERGLWHATAEHHYPLMQSPTFPASGHYLTHITACMGSNQAASEDKCLDLKF